MAGKAKRIHVVQAEKGWVARAENQKRAVGVAPTQEAAQQLARQALQNSSHGGELVTHGRSGRIRESDTINRKDPFPPKG